MKLKVSFRADTFTQSIAPLIHRSVDNVLIKATPIAILHSTVLLSDASTSRIWQRY